MEEPGWLGPYSAPQPICTRRAPQPLRRRASQTVATATVLCRGQFAGSAAGGARAVDDDPGVHRVQEAGEGAGAARGEVEPYVGVVAPAEGGELHGRIGEQSVGDETAEVSVGSDQQDPHRAAPGADSPGPGGDHGVLLRGGAVCRTERPRCRPRGGCARHEGWTLGAGRGSWRPARCGVGRGPGQGAGRVNQEDERRRAAHQGRDGTRTPGVGDGLDGGGDERAAGQAGREDRGEGGHFGRAGARTRPARADAAVAEQVVEQQQRRRGSRRGRRGPCCRCRARSAPPGTVRAARPGRRGRGRRLPGAGAARRRRTPPVSARGQFAAGARSEEVGAPDRGGARQGEGQHGCGGGDGPSGPPSMPTLSSPSPSRAYAISQQVQARVPLVVRCVVPRGPRRSAARRPSVTARPRPAATARRGCPSVSRSPATVAAHSAPGSRESTAQSARAPGCSGAAGRGAGSESAGRARVHLLGRARTRPGAGTVRPCGRSPRVPPGLLRLQGVDGTLAEFTMPVHQRLHGVHGTAATTARHVRAPPEALPDRPRRRRAQHPSRPVRGRSSRRSSPAGSGTVARTGAPAAQRAGRPMAMRRASVQRPVRGPRPARRTAGDPPASSTTSRRTVHARRSPGNAGECRDVLLDREEFEGSRAGRRAQARTPFGVAQQCYARLGERPRIARRHHQPRTADDFDDRADVRGHGGTAQNMASTRLIGSLRRRWRGRPRRRTRTPPRGSGPPGRRSPRRTPGCRRP